MAERAGARMMALAACMGEAGTLCRTNQTFDGNGRKSSQRSNRVFDLVWRSQGLLGIRHYYDGEADGAPGPGTRAAIRSFQSRLGRPATGALDHELFDRLIDAVGGVQRFVTIVKRDILEPNRGRLGARVFAQAPSPALERSFSLELALRPRDSRLTGLATYLASDGHPCSLPALDATPVRDASSGVWAVDCVEADYTVDLTSGSARVWPRRVEPAAELPSKERTEMLR